MAHNYITYGEGGGEKEFKKSPKIYLSLDYVVLHTLSNLT